MKHVWLHIIRHTLLGVVTFSAGPAGAASAAGPYYATPSWDQTLPASTRFIVLTNMSSAAVLDRETGLVWEQAPASTSMPSWYFAQVHCIELTTGGRRGWRLPTLEELASLVDPAESDPSLPNGHPFSNVASSNTYWSATSDNTNNSNAWSLSFQAGGVFVSPKTNSVHVWCARGGRGVESQ